jgi:RecB family endonuclease NucS
MIDISRPFSLYARCEVKYDGRAYSVLEEGNYLILYKGDGSLQIHGSTKIQPRNYQGAKSILEQRGHLLISRNRKETITIIIHKVINITYLQFWSEAEISIKRTEQELVQKIFDNWGDYIDGEFEVIEKEYPTKYGPVDLIGLGKEIVAIVEVKRRKATVSDCTQLRRYIEAVEAPHVTGYLAAPQIGDNAAKYLEEHGCGWIRVEFDII